MSSSSLSSNSKEVQNFMAGTSFTMNPLMTLKFVTASSIFGEPSYYRDSDERKPSVANASSSRRSFVASREVPAQVKKYLIFPEIYESPNETTPDIFIKVIDKALDYDFKATLEFAKKLRSEFHMRLNPNIIFVRASLHPKRVEFNKQNPRLMRNIGLGVVQRPDDMTAQFKYYLSLKGSKNSLPNVMKRLWAEKLSKCPRYQLKKYMNTGKLIDLVRVSHAKSKDIDEMMKTGTIETADDEKTWEVLRASGKSWKEILEQIEIPHMALLRNLRGMEGELNAEELKPVCSKLLEGVAGGKQFPFRYYSAYQNVTSPAIKSALDTCINRAMVNFPKLKGKTMSLCDNSGSAHGTFTSSYGSVKVSTIANLSGVMTAVNSDSGEVGLFGDTLFKIPIDRNEGILKQLDRLELKATSVGMGSENGVWMFFDEAIKKNLHYDNIFLFSDQQCGHGRAYGKSNEYKDYIYGGDNGYGSHYIDVLKLVEAYRRKVNPKVNVFSCQVSGYDNSVIPENIYRGALLSGWTGNEASYAKTLIDLWDEVDSKTSEI